MRRLSLLIGAVSLLLLSGCGETKVSESVEDTKESASISSQQDERVEDMFPYINADRSVNAADFEGLWREKDSDEPFFVEFSEGKNITVYQKSPDKEVLFGRGSYSLDEGSFISARVNLLGNGDMPTELGAEIE